MLIEIGPQFPKNWLWGKYEDDIIKLVCDQINQHWSESRNLFINTTWFGPTFNNGVYQQALALSGQIDNLFLLATVDPMYISPPDFQGFLDQMKITNVYKIGNYDDSPYEFNFFAPILANEFVEYPEQDLILTEIKYKFLNYNRKPRFHRVKLVKKIIELGLDQHGIQTLGRPDRTFDHDSTNDLFISIGERPEDYINQGDWFTRNDPTGIPHDVLSLHNMKYWRHHFLNIVGATMFWPWDDIFVSETQFKPILGLRPFVINGNLRTYQWLRDRGFCTFNHYFPFANLDDIHEDNVHGNIIKLLEWLVKQDNTFLLQMYQDMLPDLQYNKQRFYEFAKEQKYKMENLF